MKLGKSRYVETRHSGRNHQRKDDFKSCIYSDLESFREEG